MPTGTTIITTLEALSMLSDAIKQYIDNYDMENQIGNELATDEEVINMLDEALYSK